MRDVLGWECWGHVIRVRWQFGTATRVVASAWVRDISWISHLTGSHERPEADASEGRESRGRHSVAERAENSQYHGQPRPSLSSQRGIAAADLHGKSLLQFSPFRSVMRVLRIT